MPRPTPTEKYAESAWWGAPARTRKRNYRPAPPHTARANIPVWLKKSSQKPALESARLQKSPSAFQTSAPRTDLPQSPSSAPLATELRSKCSFALENKESQSRKSKGISLAEYSSRDPSFLRPDYRRCNNPDSCTPFAPRHAPVRQKKSRRSSRYRRGRGNNGRAWKGVR